MILLLSLISGTPQCRVSLYLNRSVQSWTQPLSSGQCVSLHADGHNSRFSYWGIGSTNTIHIEHYSCKWSGSNCTLTRSGETPDIHQFGKVPHAPLKYYFTAVNDTLLTLTYADLLDFRCDRVMLNAATPWTCSVPASDTLTNRTCLLPLFPYSKSIDVTWSGCVQSPCGTVRIYGNGTRNASFIRNVTKPGLTQMGDLPSQVLVVIEPNATDFEVKVESQGEPFPNVTVIDWPSEGVLLPKQGPPSTLSGDLSIMIVSAAFGLLLHIALGFVWIKEQKNIKTKRKLEEESSEFRDSGISGNTF
jgi:hypothetical protein